MKFKKFFALAFFPKFRRSLIFNNNLFCSNRCSKQVFLTCPAKLHFYSSIPLRYVHDDMSKVEFPDKSCWNCHTPRAESELFCPVCKSLQQLNTNRNYFEVLGLNITYQVDLAQLKANFLKLQSQFHPDKFSNKSQTEQHLSEQHASIINKAYTTLMDPLERGFYLLHLKGIEIDERFVQMDKVFLMEVMEFNEKLESVDSDKHVFQLEEENKNDFELASRLVEEAFTSNDLEAAKLSLAKMKYYRSNMTRIKTIKSSRSMVD